MKYQLTLPSNKKVTGDIEALGMATKSIITQACREQLPLDIDSICYREDVFSPIQPVGVLIKLRDYSRIRAHLKIISTS